MKKGKIICKEYEFYFKDIVSYNKRCISGFCDYFMNNVDYFIKNPLIKKTGNRVFRLKSGIAIVSKKPKINMEIPYPKSLYEYGNGSTKESIEENFLKKYDSADKVIKIWKEKVVEDMVSYTKIEFKKKDIYKVKGVRENRVKSFLRDMLAEEFEKTSLCFNTETRLYIAEGRIYEKE